MTIEQGVSKGGLRDEPARPVEWGPRGPRLRLGTALVARMRGGGAARSGIGRREGRRQGDG